MFQEGHFSSLPRQWSGVRRPLCWIYMPGRLAKMLVDRSIVVNLQGCTSHTATNLANSAKIKRFPSSPSISRWSGISWSVWPVLLRTRMARAVIKHFHGFEFPEVEDPTNNKRVRDGVKWCQKHFQGKGWEKCWAPVQSPAVRINRPLDNLG